MTNPGQQEDDFRHGDNRDAGSGMSTGKPACHGASHDRCGKRSRQFP
jgi:hypothetical protein